MTHRKTDQLIGRIAVRHMSRFYRYLEQWRLEEALLELDEIRYVINRQISEELKHEHRNEP